MLNAVSSKSLKKHFSRISGLEKSLITVLLILIFTVSGIAQKKKDPVLLMIAGENITKSEFLNIYNKNNIKGDKIDQESLHEYLDLFINFKLKVKEATELGYDTTIAFTNELDGYRKQLAQPYLTDKNVMDELIKEAYGRMKYDIRFSHILVRIPPTAKPEDTVAAYKKIMNIRERIIKGEDFNKVASEVSDDYSARDTVINGREYKGNRGELGYFTVFDIPFYDFETAAYNTPEGQVSLPVRTKIGYHLIKVMKKIEALGRFQVAYILVSIPKEATHEDSLSKETLINEIYQKVLQGEDFAVLAKEYSDDKASAAKGGLLPWYGVNKLVPEFIDAVSTLKNPGDVSKPIHTQYGWNIIKLVDQKKVGSFDEMKAEIKQNITKDERSAKSMEIFLQKLKKEYGFKENKDALADFYNVVDTTVFQRAWTTEKAKGLNKPLCSVGEKKFTQKDFAEFLASRQRNRTPEVIVTYVNEMYDNYVEENLINYEDSKLEKKYPEFAALMKEYHDGILLFNLMQEKVWTKAVKDTTGLAEFYEGNKNKYMWGERLIAVIYNCVNEKIADETRKLLSTKNYDEENILLHINADTVNKELGLNLIVDHRKFSRGDDENIDKMSWEEGISDNFEKNGRIIFYVIQGKLDPEPKSLDEAKGPITSDYQDHLEDEWIKELKAKYPVKVDKKVLGSIK